MSAGTNVFGGREYRKYVSLKIANNLKDLGWDIYTKYQYVNGDHFTSKTLEECIALEQDKKPIVYVPDILQAHVFLNSKFPEYQVYLEKPDGNGWRGVVVKGNQLLWHGLIYGENKYWEVYGGAILECTEILKREFCQNT